MVEIEWRLKMDNGNVFGRGIQLIEIPNAEELRNIFSIFAECADDTFKLNG